MYVDEIELDFLDNETVAFNSLYDTRAAVYHGNGPSKVVATFCETKYFLKVFLKS